VESANSAFHLDIGRIRLADLIYIYPERMPAPTSLLPVNARPRSYGIAPMAVVPPSAGTADFRRVVLVAVAESEALWLGFQAVDRTRPGQVRVRIDGLVNFDALTGGLWIDDSPVHLTCPPQYWLSGTRRQSGWEAFGTAGAPTHNIVQRLTVFARIAQPLSQDQAVAPWSTANSATLELVRPAFFERVTGEHPTPVDPDAAYKGWRLP
jgi:hypothetical protein